MTKSPEETTRESIAPTKSTLIGVSAPTFPLTSEVAPPSSKSTLIGLTAPSMPPPTADVGGSAKSTLIGLTPPTLPPPAAASKASVKSTPPAGASTPPWPREATDARAALPAGAVFDGRYRVTRALARGRIATIYAVQSIDHGAARALKVLKATARDSKVADERVLEDLSLAESVVSEHVATVFESGCTEGGAVWFASELLEGATLAQRAASTSREALTRGDVWKVLLQVALGLDAAHAKGLVHRDLRPSNVFLATQRSGAAKATLLDFGLAHRVEWERAHGGADVSAAWVAPECVEGASVTPGADFWSFGLLAFWLFTGRSYWPTGRVRLDAPIVLASERCVELAVARRLPDGFDAWFEQCVARSPRDRFRTARDLSVELMNMFHASPESDAAAGFVPEVIVADDVRGPSPARASVDAVAPPAEVRRPPRLPMSTPSATAVSTEHATGAASHAPTPPSTTEARADLSALADAPIISDDDVRVISIETRMTADEARATAEAMRATRDPQRISIPAERAPVSQAPPATPRTAITAPFPVVRASDPVVEELDHAVSDVLRGAVLDAAPPASSDPPAVRYSLPLVSKRRLPSLYPAARAVKVGAALLLGSCAVFGIAWFVATSERVASAPTPRAGRIDAARVGAPPVIAEAHVDAATASQRVPVEPPSTPAPVATAGRSTSAASSPGATSSLSMHGWGEGAVRVWVGDLDARRARLPFTLALRRRRRFTVAGFFIWSFHDAQVRENLIGTYDPSAMLIRVHGTSSSDPLRMPVGAYALRVARAGDLVGSTMVRASRLTGSLDAAAAARVSTFLLPDARDPDAGTPR